MPLRLKLYRGAKRADQHAAELADLSVHGERERASARFGTAAPPPAALGARLARTSDGDARKDSAAAPLASVDHLERRVIPGANVRAAQAG